MRCKQFADPSIFKIFADFIVPLSQGKGGRVGVSFILRFMGGVGGWFPETRINP